MLDSHDAQGDGEYLSAVEERVFLDGCAQLDALGAQIGEMEAASEYWPERMAEGEAVDLDEPAWAPTPLTAGEQLGIVDPTMPSPKGQLRLQELRRRLYATGQL
jgi:hypothetical protein